MTTTKTSSPAATTQILSSGHKEVGRLMIGASVLVTLIALVAAAAAGFEAIDLASFDLFQNADQFRQIWSVAREVLILGAILPGFVGLALYMVPLQVGANGLAFEKGATAGFWTWAAGLVLLVISYVFDGGPAGERLDFVLLWTMAAGLMAIGLIWALASVAATVLAGRAQGMDLSDAPVSVWSFLVFAFSGSFVLGVFVAELAISYIRLRSGHLPIGNTFELLSISAPFLRSASSLFVLVPVLGLTTEVVAVHTGRPVVDTRPVMVPIGFLGFLAAVGGSAYFTTIRPVESVFFHGLVLAGALGCIGSVLFYNLVKIIKSKKFSSITMGAFAGLQLAFSAGVVLSVDTIGTRISEIEIEPLSVSTVQQDLINAGVLEAEGLYAFGPVFPLLVGAALISIHAAALHWSVKIWGRHLTSSMVLVSNLLTAVGAVAWAIGQLASTLLLDSIELSVGAADNSGEWFAALPVIGMVAMGVGSLLMIANVASLATSKVTGSAKPKWEGLTLEWATANPPVKENFPSLPVVSSAVPLTEEVFVSAPEAPEIESKSDMPELEAGVS